MDARSFLEQFANRTDAFGLYTKEGKSFTKKAPVTEDLIAAHLDGTKTIGLHTTDPDTSRCRWACWDVDAHDEPKANAEAAALALLSTLRGLGVEALVEDSGGGFHVWAFFTEPVPAASVRSWAPPCEIEGKPVEFFPKQDRLNPEKGKRGHYGNFVRLPGKHHKRGTWSKVWSGFDWIEWPDCVELFVDPPMNDPAILPAEPVVIHQPGEVSSTPGAPLMDYDAHEEDLSKLRELISPDGPLSKDPFLSDHDKWLKVGMVIHSLGGTLREWIRWSTQSEKFDLADCDKRWASFGMDHANPVGIGTLIRWAGEDSAEFELRKLERSSGTGEEVEVIDPATFKLNGEGRGEVIEGLSKILRVPVERWIQRSAQAGTETYFLKLRGRDSEIRIGNAREVLSYTNFRAAIYAEVGITLPGTMKKWSRVCDQLSRIREVVEVQEETREGVLVSILESYLESSGIYEKTQDTVRRRDSFIYGNCLYVHVGRLVEWARRERVPLPKPLYAGFVEMRWEQETVSMTTSSRSYYRTPLDSLTVPEGARGGVFTRESSGL